MVRMDYMKIELDLYKHMYELSSQTNVLDTWLQAQWDRTQLELKAIVKYRKSLIEY